MMSNHHLLFILLLACLPLRRAADHLVGGDRGWTLDVDYPAWAAARRFHVGDRLIFTYQRGDHNVFAVDEAGYAGCAVAAGAEVLDTGKDVMELTTAGRKWYICGVPSHCSVANQKLAISVLPAESKLPEPPSGPHDGSQPPASWAAGRSRANVMATFVLVVVVAMF